VGAEAAQLFLDVAHLLMFAVTWLLAPHRGVAVLAVMLERDERWRARVADKVRMGEGPRSGGKGNRQEGKEGGEKEEVSERALVSDDLCASCVQTFSFLELLDDRWSQFLAKFEKDYQQICKTGRMTPDTDDHRSPVAGKGVHDIQAR
jgi:hypothetical protein